MSKIIYIMAAIILASLMYYSYSEHDKYYPSLADFLKDPAKYDGIATEHQSNIFNVTDDSFMLRSGSSFVTVKYPDVRYPKYGTLNFMGYYRKEGYIEATRIKYNDYNYGKYLMSFIGLFLFLAMFFREWKLTMRGFEDARLD